ncbi:MAG TPA: hypothetical protein VKA60_17025 [Blastocatellia bacterium]|nr:hypothetical protein [Blastocatellia bacterium]
MERLSIEGIQEFWQHPADGQERRHLAYRPSVLVECSINYRSLRAGLNHSEERTYSAWLPEAGLAIDWDQPAVNSATLAQLATRPDPGIAHRDGNYQTTRADFEQYEAELIDKLVRGERLRLFFNPVFGLFSVPEETLEDFLPRIAESALSRVEPELKRLRNRFELQLEQVREAQAMKGARAEEINKDITEEIKLESLIAHKLHLFESEHRLADMFSTLAGAVFGTTEPKPITKVKWEDAELREDLDRVEQEASEALRALYEEYLALANEYDLFEIGLQPNNVQVVRRLLLWVPVAVAP